MKHTADRLDEIEVLFDQADEDGDGQVSLTEFRTLMSGLDSYIPASSLDTSFAKVDSDHNGRISFAEFRAWWLSS